jgi:hypothetical protein
MSAPCKDCEKRYLGCHSRCPEYQAFYEENKKRLEAKHQEQMSYNYTWDERIKIMRRKDKEKRR